MNANAPSRLKRLGRLRENATVRVLFLIVILFIGTYGGVAVMRFALQTDSPLMVVSSGSMIPTLNVGDIIVVRGVNPTEISVGTIIIFHSPHNYEMPIVHRVIDVVVDGNGDRYFQTKGDNNAVADNWSPLPGVPTGLLIGIFVARIPYVGLISLRLRGPTGIALILILVAAIVLLEYRDAQKKSKSKHEGSA